MILKEGEKIDKKILSTDWNFWFWNSRMGHLPGWSLVLLQWQLVGCFFNVKFPRVLLLSEWPGGKVEWCQAQAGSEVWCCGDVSSLTLVRLCAGVKVGGGLNQYWQGVGKLHENSALLSNFRVLFYNFKRLAKCCWKLLVTVTSWTSESVPTV